MLEVRSVAKRFGPTVALQNLDLGVAPGEIVGVAGPNGAGKSTLIHILSGELAEDSGAVYLDGVELEASKRSPLVSVVHQELQLFPTLTVGENLLIGQPLPRLARPKPVAETIRAVADEFGLARYLHRLVEECSVVVRQLTEIARAIIQNKPVLVLDEPNSALTQEESERMFQEVLRLKKSASKIVVLVSHRLDDLVAYCDRVAVLSEGRVARELHGTSLTTAELGRAIVAGVPLSTSTARGAEEESQAEATVAAGGVSHVRREVGLREVGARRPAVLDVNGWSDPRRGAFRGVDVVVRRGEAVFITGKEGSGGREMIKAIAGIGGFARDLQVSAQIRDLPICFVPGDRGESIFANLSVRANLAARLETSALRSRYRFLNRSLIDRCAEDLIDSLSIKTPGGDASVAFLSGGNQQKVAIGSALARRPELLLLEDPTRGVDVAARAQIVRAIRTFVEQGNAVFGFSPELDEVFELADVAYVAVNGRLSTPNRSVRSESLEELVAWVDGITAPSMSETQ